MQRPSWRIWGKPGHSSCALSLPGLALAFTLLIWLGASHVCVSWFWRPIEPVLPWWVLRKGFWVLLWTEQEYKGSLPASFLGFGFLFILLSFHLLDIIEATGFQPLPDHRRLFEVYLIVDRYLYSPSILAYSSQWSSQLLSPDHYSWSPALCNGPVLSLSWVWPRTFSNKDLRASTWSTRKSLYVPATLRLYQNKKQKY